MRMLPLASRIGFPAQEGQDEPEDASLGPGHSLSPVLTTVDVFLSLHASAVSKTIVAPEPSGHALNPAV
jgi:hypothetical protein